MTVRELLVRMGFTMDKAQARQAEATIEGLKNTATSAVNVIAGIGAALGVAFGLDKIKQVADETANLRARVGLVTKDAQEQEKVLSSIRDISNETRQGYAATGDLYAKLARSSKQFGASQEDVLKATETINKALVVGGASTAEANSTALQLGQALASGRLQGDELRSLSENAPLLMEEIAKAYGVTVGQLKQLGADGQLESEGIFRAIVKAKAKMDKEFERMPITVGQAMTVAGNYFTYFIEDVEQGTGIFKKFATDIVNAVKWIDNEIRYIAKRVGGFGNLFKIASAIIAAFGAGMVALKWNAIVAGIRSVTTALMAFAANPAAWTAMAIAAAVLLIALALEDLYTWINGGDSIIGDWLGSWEEFRAKALAAWKAMDDFFKNLPGRINATINEIGNWFSSLWDDVVTGATVAWNSILSGATMVYEGICAVGEFYFSMLLAIWQGVVNAFLTYLQFWRQVFEGDFSGAIDTVIGFFQNLLTTALSILSQIGSAIGRFVLSKLGAAGQMLAKLAGIDLKAVVSTQDAAGAGVRGTGGMNNEINVNVTTPEGTTAAQADYLQQSAEQSYDGVYNTLAFAGGD